VTSPLAECIRSQSTLQCRVSTIFSVCLDAVTFPWFLLGLSANCPALPQVMWSKYCSFSFATLPINSLFKPNSVNIESFVRCSCHEMLSIFLQHHISKASIMFLSDFFKVHPSTPYWNTADTIWVMTAQLNKCYIGYWKKEENEVGHMSRGNMWSSKTLRREDYHGRQHCHWLQTEESWGIGSLNVLVMGQTKVR